MGASTSAREARSRRTELSNNRTPRRGRIGITTTPKSAPVRHIRHVYWSGQSKFFRGYERFIVPACLACLAVIFLGPRMYFRLGKCSRQRVEKNSQSLAATVRQGSSLKGPAAACSVCFNNNPLGFA